MNSNSGVSAYTTSKSLLQYKPPEELTQEDENEFVNEKKQLPPIESNPTPKDTWNAMFPPKITEEKQSKLIQFVSDKPATREQARDLFKALDEKIKERQAREKGICPVREELYSQCFDEIIRQVTIECPERGLWLLKVRDETRMTIASYQTLYESAILFGIRKQLQLQVGKEDLKKHIEEWEKQKAALLNERTNLDNEFRAFDKKNHEINKIETTEREKEAEFHKRQNNNLDKFIAENIR